MKHFLIIICLQYCCSTLTAQVVAKEKPKPADAEVLSFSSNLAEGAIVFTKTFRKNNPTDYLYTAHYTISNRLYKDGNPVEVGLNRLGFDTYFASTPLLMDSRAKLITYALAMNLSFTEEKGWTVLMNYYNQNCVK